MVNAMTICFWRKGVAQSSVCCFTVAVLAYYFKQMHSIITLRFSVNNPVLTLCAISDVFRKSCMSSHLEGLLCDGSRGHIHAHQFKGLSLLRHSFSNVAVRLAYEVTHFTGSEDIRGRGLPHGGDGRVSASHLSLEVFASEFLSKVGGEVSVKASVGKTHAAESHLEGDVSILADEVFTGEEDSAKAIVDDILSHLCGVSDRDRVSVDHSESLLVDGVLRAGGGDLLLVVVAIEVI